MSTPYDKYDNHTDSDYFLLEIEPTNEIASKSVFDIGNNIEGHIKEKYF